MSKKIFISYKRKDKDVVYGIVKAIEDATGEECWIDTSIESAELFESVIINSIENADIVIFMMSKNSIAPAINEKTGKPLKNSISWTEREIKYAINCDKKVVPVSIDGTTVSDCKWLKFHISHYNYVDYRNEDQRKRFLRDVQRWVDGAPYLMGGNLNLERINDRIPLKVGDCTVRFVKVEGGEFFIGAEKDPRKEAKPNEKPPLRLTVDTFYVSEMLVTQKLWKTVMGYSDSEDYGSNYPVMNLTLEKAKKFVHKMSEKTQRIIDIPTEEEWEYAAKGGKDSKGYMYAGSDNIDDVAWYRANSGKEPHPVGLKAPNELGIYDMSGNVWELAYALGQHGYTGLAKRCSERKNTEVLRGGSCSYSYSSSRVSNRYFHFESVKPSFVGLRLVMLVDKRHLMAGHSASEND